MHESSPDANNGESSKFDQKKKNSSDGSLDRHSELSISS